MKSLLKQQCDVNLVKPIVDNLVSESSFSRNNIVDHIADFEGER